MSNILKSQYTDIFPWASMEIRIMYGMSREQLKMYWDMHHT